MSASHVTTVRDLLDVLKEGSMVYSQASRRTEGGDRTLFERLGEAKRLQAHQFSAWCARHPEDARRPLTLNEGVHRAYAHLHSILRFHPDPEQVLLRELDDAEVRILGAFRTAVTMSSDLAQRELAALGGAARQAHEELAFALGPASPVRSGADETETAPSRRVAADV